MNGRIISGTYNDPEITRLEGEIERLNRTSSTNASGAWLKSANTAAIDQLKSVLEHRKRMAQKRALVYDGSGDAMDKANALAEAMDLARRMKAQGYTRAQIRATVRPMVVNPEGTVTGRKERKAKRKARREERKKAGKGVFRKIGAALKKGAQFVFKGLAKLNPALAIGRAATLQLVSRNNGGIASKMQRGGADKAKKKWEAMGGEWPKLKRAIEKGAGSPITGFPIGADDDKEADLPKEGDKDFLDKLFALAKPLLKQLLAAFGINITKDKGTGKVKVDLVEGGAADVELKRQLERGYAKVGFGEEAVEQQVKDAVDPNTGGGPGYNSGDAKMDWAVWAGIAAVAILAIASNTSHHGQKKAA